MTAQELGTLVRTLLARQAAAEDRQAVLDVLLRYWRGIDRRDWELVRSCYYVDALDDHGEYQGSVDGFITFTKERIERYESTMHIVGNQLVELEGDVAQVESYCIGYHRIPASEPVSSAGGTRGSRYVDPACPDFGLAKRAPHDLIVGMRYLDRLARRCGEWRIARRVVVMDWSRVDPISESFAYGATAVMGRFFPDDSVYQWDGVQRGATSER